MYLKHDFRHFPLTDTIGVTASWRPRSRCVTVNFDVDVIFDPCDQGLKGMPWNAEAHFLDYPSTTSWWHWVALPCVGLHYHWGCFDRYILLGEEWWILGYMAASKGDTHWSMYCVYAFYHTYVRMCVLKLYIYYTDNIKKCMDSVSYNLWCLSEGSDQGSQR